MKNESEASASAVAIKMRSDERIAGIGLFKAARMREIELTDPSMFVRSRI
jgi:hypothetical protein